MNILPDLSKPDHEALSLQAQIEKLKAENAALRASRPQPGVSFKVTEKGGVSVYGLGRFPVTLYRGQWEKLMANVDRLKAFIDANANRLSVKE